MRQGRAALQGTYLEEAGGKQAAKANIGSCCLCNWKDNEIKDQHPFPLADQMHTCRLCPVHKGPPFLPRNCCPLHNLALTSPCSTELRLLSPRAGMFPGELTCEHTHVPAHQPTQTFIFAKAPTLLSMTAFPSSQGHMGCVHTHKRVCEYGYRITK